MSSERVWYQTGNPKDAYIASTMQQSAYCDGDCDSCLYMSFCNDEDEED